MILKRNLLGWRFEEYWFDEPGYLASTADIVALRTFAAAPRHHCSIPERTLLVTLEPSEEAIQAAFRSRARTYLRQAAKSIRVERAATPEARDEFYRAYSDFAARKGLLLPNPEEEGELEIFLARENGGELIQAAAFFPARNENIYRYRYGVYLKKAHANVALFFEAMRRGKELGFARFDLGGVTPGAKPGSPEAGINFFKGQFGGHETECHLYLRGTRPATRLLFSLLGMTGLAARYHALSALAGRIARR